VAQGKIDDALERCVYSPYGVFTIYDATWSNIRSDSSYDIEYPYTGRRLDEETGLYYYRHRQLSPQLGRFLSRDPVGYRGGLSQYAMYFVANGLDPAGMCLTRPGIGLGGSSRKDVACCEFSRSEDPNSESWVQEVPCPESRTAFGCCMDNSHGWFSIFHVRRATHQPCSHRGGRSRPVVPGVIGGQVGFFPRSGITITPGQACIAVGTSLVCALAAQLVTTIDYPPDVETGGDEGGGVPYTACCAWRQLSTRRLVRVDVECLPNQTLFGCCATYALASEILRRAIDSGPLSDYQGDLRFSHRGPCESLTFQ